YLLFQQCIGNTARQKTFPGSHCSPEEVACIFRLHYFPVFHIKLCKHGIFGKSLIILKCPFLHGSIRETMFLQFSDYSFMTLLFPVLFLLFSLLSPAPTFTRMFFNSQNSDFFLIEISLLRFMALSTIQKPIFSDVILSGSFSRLHYV